MFNIENLVCRTYDPDTADQRLFKYISVDDLSTDVVSVGYFNTSNMRMGDLVVGICTDATLLLKVNAVTPNCVTVEMVEATV